MKVALKLDKDTVQTFFIENSEKVAFGLIVLVALMTAYGAVSRKGYTRTPEELKQTANKAEEYINQEYKPGLTPKDPRGDLRNPNRPKIDPNYAWTPWVFPVRKPKVLRDMPKVLPVEQLVAEPGRGAIVAQPEAGARNPQGPRVAGGAGEVQGQRWILVKGLVPLKKQKEAIKECYQNCTLKDPSTDTAKYVGFYVERAEMDSASSGEPKWTTQYSWVDIGKLQKSWSAPAPEMIDPKFLQPRLSWPLPMLADRQWGSEAAYPPQIPIFEPAEGEQPEGGQPGHGGQPGRGRPPAHGGPFGNRPGAAAPGFPGGRPGMPGRNDENLDEFGDDMDPHAKTPGAKEEGGEAVQEDLDPEYLLFRFIDFDVEPGRYYRYRVFLMVRNPNYNLPVKELLEEKFAKAKFVGQIVKATTPAKAETPAAKTKVPAKKTQELDEEKKREPFQIDADLATWSAPTSAVTLPEDMQLLAGGVKTPQKASEEITAAIRVVKWIKALGETAVGQIELCRGRTVNFEGKVELKTTGETIDVDFHTGELVVDLAGGEALDTQRKSFGPGEVLVMDRDKNLVIHYELDDDRKMPAKEPSVKEAADPEREPESKPKPPRPDRKSTLDKEFGGSEKDDPFERPKR